MTDTNDTRTVDEMLDQFTEQFVGAEYDEDGATVVIDRVRYDEAAGEFRITYYKHMEYVKSDFEITPEDMKRKFDEGTWEVPE